MAVTAESNAGTERPANPAQRFIPVHIDSLDPQVLDMDLWLRHDGHPAPALYRAAGLEVTLGELQRLKDQRIKYLYIPAHQHAIYRRVLTKRLDTIFTDPDRAAEERARIIRDNCSKMIEDVLLLPGQTEPIETVAEISRTFQTWVAKDEGQFGYLLAMSAHDFYTSTHMVNVGVGCGLLVRALRPTDESLFSIAVQGGLLHDVGKRDIPPEILNKAGKLDPDEWEVLRRHPAVGYDELAKHASMPPAVLEMTRDHHERLDGKGYPNGIFADQIGFLARVCAVVDVFDAITSTRPYRGPTHPRDALKVMADSVGSQFDKEIFEAWKEMVEKLLEKDPSRVGDVVEGTVSAEITNVLPHAPPGFASASLTSGPGPVAIGEDNRRRFTRFTCSTMARARFVEQSRPHPVVKGEPFTVRLVDVSRGGACAEADWSFAKGEVVHVTIPSSNGKTLSRYARVARVRSGGRGKWLIGLTFIEAPKE